jgi:polyhydroxybutyrate depolymerase
MKQFLLSILLLSSLKSIAQTTIVDSVLVDGIFRSYRLYVPAIYNGSTARPLIINLHGYTSNAFQQQIYSNFMPIADTANFLMVCPNGTFNGANRFWNAGISPAAVNDVSFISQLIDSLDLVYDIDLTRVYSTGMSNGGFMSHTLACELSSRIAAIASVTGSIFTSQAGSNCVPLHPTPVMQIHGTNDATVPYIGSSTMLSIDEVVSYWRTFNNCDPTPTFTAIPNTSLADGCTAERYVYTNGNQGSTVELFKIIGGSHSWAGFPFGGTGTNLDINASLEIWRFFSKYNLPTAGFTENKTELSFEIYPNPSIDNISIRFTNSLSEYIVCIKSVQGETILETKNNTFIDVSMLSSGVYFVEIGSENNMVSVRKFVKE